MEDARWKMQDKKTDAGGARGGVLYVSLGGGGGVAEAWARCMIQYIDCNIDRNTGLY